MNHIKVNWIHSFPDEPVMIYNELDEQRWTTRVIEVFANGHVGYASATEQAGTTGLGEEPVPPLAEITRDCQFRPVEITKEEFEMMWAKRKAAWTHDGSHYFGDKSLKAIRIIHEFIRVHCILWSTFRNSSRQN